MFHFVSVDHSRDKDLPGIQPDVLLCRDWPISGVAGCWSAGRIPEKHRPSEAGQKRKRNRKRKISPADLRRHHEHLLACAPRDCPTCGQRFTPTRRDRRYCSRSCMLKAMRKRWGRKDAA